LAPAAPPGAPARQDPRDQSGKGLPPILKRTLAEIVSVERQEIERDERSTRRAGLRPQGR